MKTILALALLAGCQMPAAETPTAAPVVTPADAEAATYKLFASYGQGTGWAVDENHLITAGHMCGDDVGAKLTARDRDGHQFQVEVVDWELDDDGDVVKDVCLLKTDHPLHPIALASDMPVVGETAWFVGYPQGTFVVSSGKYLGDIDGVQKWDDYTVSAPCDHGASGSAFFTENGVFGVLVRVIVTGDQVHDGAEGCVATPLADIKSILARNIPITE